MRYLKFVCVAFLCCLISFKGVALYTGNFSKTAITNHFPVHGSHPTNPSNEIKHKLQQTFYYLSRGHQTYAFIGEDGNTVIKFFNFSQLQHPLWLWALPKIGPIRNYRQRKNKGYKHRLERLFKGHQIAEKTGGKLYGFTYLHLKETQGYFHQPINVVDAIGFHHLINPDEVVFVVQDKAIIAREMFSLLLAKDDLNGVKQRIDQLFDLYLQEFRKGIMDKDPNIIDNVGFVDNRAIRIDVGRLREIDQMRERDQLIARVKKKFYRWVDKYHPGYAKEISQYLETKSEELHSSFLYE